MDVSTAISPVSRLRTAALVMAVLSTAPSCATNERDGDTMMTRGVLDEAETIADGPTWTTKVDTLPDAVVVRTDIANDAETALRLNGLVRLKDGRLVLLGPAESSDDRLRFTRTHRHALAPPQHPEDRSVVGSAGRYRRRRVRHVVVPIRGGRPRGLPGRARRLLGPRRRGQRA